MSRNEKTARLLEKIIGSALLGGASLPPSHRLRAFVAARRLRRRILSEEMPAFIEAGYPDRLGPTQGTAVTNGNDTVAIFQVDGVIHAIEAWCLRCGACLAEGGVAGSIVACRGCDWRYEVTTGAVVGLAALRLDTFNVEVVKGRIIITGS